MDGLYQKITQDYTPDAKEARFGGRNASIAVEKGDIIFDVKKLEDGWLYGKNLNSGKAGKFPSKCCAALLESSNSHRSGNGPTGLRKTEPRKSEVKQTPAGSGETAGNQAKRSVTPRSLKTFGKQPQESGKCAEKDSSGDSGVVTDELAKSKPAAKSNTEDEAPSDGKFRARNNSSLGRLREPTHAKQPPGASDRKMEESNDRPAKPTQAKEDNPKAKANDTTYSRVAKASPDRADLTSKSHNAAKPESVDIATVNVQENPLNKQLAKDAEEGIYQVPNVSAPPPKPPHVLPEEDLEDKVPHEYATPENDYTPPASPAPDRKTAEKKPDKKSKAKEKSDKKKPQNKNKPRESVKMKEIRRAPEGSRGEKSKGPCGAEKWPKMKILLGIGVGVVVGVFCFLLLYLLFGRHVLTGVVVAIIIGVVVSVVLGFLEATRLKCIVLLVIPSLCSAGAKVSLWILITYFLVYGPLHNFIDNVRITAVTRGCAMTQGGGIAVETADPRTEHLVNDIEKFENLTEKLGFYLIEALNRNESNSGSLICMRELFNARNTCSEAFESLYNNCTQYLKRSGMQQRRCSDLVPRERACPHLSISFIRSTCGMIDSAHLSDLTNMTLILNNRPISVVNNSGENRSDYSSGHVYTELNAEYLESAMSLLLLLILVVLYEAYRYQKHYLVYNEFDNCYLTTHFKSIEDTRRAGGANDGLIPLKKSELQKYVQPTSCRLSRAEKKSLLKYLIIFVVYALFALLFLLSDAFFYHAITSKEPGLDARTNASSPGCGLDLKAPDREYTVITSVLLGLLLLIILLQPYALRLRRYIASRFYRTRERKRVTYLYYKLLEERKKFFKVTIEKINSVSEENEMLRRLDATLVLARRFPALGKVMEFVGFSLNRCMVCGTGLNRKYVTCETEECGAVYCRTCFWDVESNCLGCMSSSRLSSPPCSTAETAERKKSDHVRQV